MATVHEFGPFRLDAEAEILFHGSEPIVLGQRAVALLRTLLERAGAPVSKDALIEAAWPGLAIEDSNLTVQIAALRRVLQEKAGDADWIETLPRRGYRYVGPPGRTAHSPTDVNAQNSLSFALPDKPSVAVLPFANLSGDPQQDYFIAGMVEDSIAGLGRTAGEIEELLMDRAGVACLAGTAFGAAGEGYLRFSYANSVANIRAALDAVRDALAAL